MATVVELPDELIEQAKAIAATHSQDLGQFLRQAVEQAIADSRAMDFRQQLEALAQENAAAWRGDKPALEQLFEDRAARCR